MQRIACTLVVLLLGAPSAYGQVVIDASTSTGHGVNATTVRLTGTLLTPIPCCAPGAYTVDFQWDPSRAVLVPVAIVTGPNGPFLPNLTGTYSVSLNTTQTNCANPTFNGTFSAVGTVHLTQRGDTVTGFGGTISSGGAVNGVGVDAVVTTSAATGQIQLLSTLGVLGSGTFNSTVGTMLNLTYGGSFPAVGCQFTGTGTASRVAP